MKLHNFSSVPPPRTGGNSRPPAAFPPFRPPAGQISSLPPIDSSVAAGPGTVSEPNAERQQSDEEQRLLAQRQREREENDAAWLRYLDSLEPGIRAEQEAKRLQRLLSGGDDMTGGGGGSDMTGGGGATPPPAMMKEYNGVQIPIADTCLVFSTATPTRDGVNALAFDSFGTLNTADYLVFGVWAEPMAGTEAAMDDVFLHLNKGNTVFPAANLPASGQVSYLGSWHALVDNAAAKGTAVGFVAFSAASTAARVQLNGFGAFGNLTLENFTFQNDAFRHGAIICSSSCFTESNTPAEGNFYNGGADLGGTPPSHFAGKFDLNVGTDRASAVRALGVFGVQRLGL